jgi:hypothetical protein
MLLQEQDQDQEQKKIRIFMAIALMMEAVSTSETSVSYYQTTRRNIPEDNHLHIRHHEI